MYFSLVSKGLECVDLKERNRKQMYDQLKRRYEQPKKKFNALFKKNFVKIKIQK